MSLHPYIAVEGAIGVGKTTLARILGESLPAELLLEVFEENPFLGDFYADRARYAFQTQIFFLLSRYRQQHRVIANTLASSLLVSDYLFAKDWLFAHLNLAGDELLMYERVHAILDEQIPAPSLVIYLRASTDALMERIAFRDRSYERQMERDYIDALRQAYDRFFSGYTVTPLLVLDTDGLDFVHDPQVRASVIMRIKSIIQAGDHQLPLIEVGQAPEAGPAAGTGTRVRAGDGQHRRPQAAATGFTSDPFFHYIGMTARLGMLGGLLERVSREQGQLLAQLGNRQEALDRALGSLRAELEQALLDVLAALLEVASDADIDLGAAYRGLTPRRDLGPGAPFEVAGRGQRL